MKPKLLVFPALLAVVLLLAFRIADTKKNPTPAEAFAAFKKANVVRCSPDWTAVSQWIDDVDIPPMPGVGNYQWPIDTKIDSAQFYFNQGISMYYGFHIIESMASFKKAARFDPNSAMLQWAMALAMGPNINDAAYSASPEALLTSRKALQLSANLGTKEKLLFEAQVARYSEDSTAKREDLNQAYVDKMKVAYAQLPDDADVAALYADALMLQHPWDLWKPDGTPRPWTPQIRTILEKLLAKTPNHPGANHYYIHVMEPSPFANKALASADRLAELTPGLSHMVHMPSHIYLRMGKYAKGVEVNEKAVATYKQYAKLFAPVTANDFLYVIHNLHMQVNNSMMEGRRTYSMQTAQELVNNIPKEYLLQPAPFGNLLQYIYMTPVFVHVRFGNWNELLAMQKPPETEVYSTILYHFGRGLALTQQGKLREAKYEHDQLHPLMADSSLQVPMYPFSPAIDGAKVAAYILAGSIDLAEQQFENAINTFEKAVETEEAMVYNEPRDWMLNPRHYLGNAFLKAGQWDRAKKVFQKDLENNNNNGWALFGLYQVFMNGNRKAEAQRFFKEYEKAFSKADVKLHAAVY